MASRVELFPFQVRYIEQILKIEHASFGRDAWDRDLFLEYFRRSPDLFLVARSARRIVGYIITCTARNQAELLSIAVDPRHRRRGLGRTMLDETLRRLRSIRKTNTWWLMVATTNEEAIHFYENYGFVRQRRTKGYYGSGRDAWRMKLSL